ncbi:hypothetical protein QZH41_009620 [Actinostola sp. cb2023]|nr:hypothetical protein QZH41_009620 [Actinostola sp. cb2023]
MTMVMMMTEIEDGGGDAEDDDGGSSDGDGLIIIISLPPIFYSPIRAIEAILKRFPSLLLLTSELYQDCPILFGQKYFGTDIN